MTRSERERLTPKRKKHSYYDYSLLFLTLFLVCFGLVMIYSTSSFNSQRLFDNPTYFLKKQAFAVLLGIAAMLVVSKIDYRIYIKKLPIIRIRPVTLLYILSVVLQILVLIIGDEINGAKRWIDLGFTGFQPSDISKVATILFVAYVVNTAPRRLDKINGFFRIAVYMAPLLGLIAKENLSTAIVIAGIMISICFVASRKKLYFIVVGLLVIAVGSIYIFGVGYRSERVDVWRNVETHEKGFQILQGLFAIASGGIFGTGLGESMQKLGFIPEAHNDMIFTIICEELGLFGATAVILLFLLLIWRLFIIAINAPDLFGGLIAVGVLAHIAIQVILNIAVVTNSIPSTGVPLPFISYGGTSVSVLLAEIGIALSVSGQIKNER
ncbi:MAG TPA: putative peptidoglycan glycosyltransferase FtsW [Lachnospiraceae bacterium]|nr:putative peptidoglycan glycosyltransferase FtsW [Lachnospiraceae bacterium]